VTVSGCTLSGNSAGAGGGILITGGTTTISGCTLSDNSASAGIDGGGGIANIDGWLTVTNSLLSGNTGGPGSGILNGYALAVRGIVTIDGDYFQAGGTLSLNIGGTQAGTDYDQLVVNGFATLGGTLQISLVNGYQPQPGYLFQPLLFAQGEGTFAHYTGDISGFSFLYVYHGGDFFPPGLTLVAKQPPRDGAGPDPAGDLPHGQPRERGGALTRRAAARVGDHASVLAGGASGDRGAVPGVRAGDGLPRDALAERWFPPEGYSSGSVGELERRAGVLRLADANGFGTRVPLAE
jgi:hypothetical protein